MNHKKLIWKIVFVLILYYLAISDSRRLATLSDEQLEQIAQNAEPADNGYDLAD